MSIWQEKHKKKQKASSPGCSRSASGIKSGFCMALLAGILLAGIKDVRAEAADSPLRCVAFYSRVNGVNSTVYQVIESLSENLGKEEEGRKVALSVYHLAPEYYNSLEYKVRAAALMEMDALIVNDLPANDESIRTILEEAGIFALIVDGQPSAYSYSACIGTDNRGAGAEAASLAGEQAGEMEQTYAGILATLYREGSLSASRLERLEGFQAAAGAEEKERMEVLPVCICSSDTLEARERIRVYLEEYPQISFLFCLDSASGIVASQVLTEQGRQQDIFVLCFDNTAQVQEEMYAGGIDAVFVQDTGEIGRECASILEAFARGADPMTYAGTERLIPARLVTADQEPDTVLSPKGKNDGQTQPVEYKPACIEEEEGK